MLRRTRAVSGLLTLVLVLFAGAGIARAEDDAAKLEEGTKLVDAIEAAIKEKDTATLETQAKQAVEIHNAVQDKGLRGKLVKELGAILKSRHVESTHVAVLAAVADLDDSKEAWKLVKRHVPGPKDEEIDDVHKAALAAADKIADDGALKTLEELAEKGKAGDYAVSAMAIQALGSYGKSKKREQVLEGLIKLIGRFMPPRGQQVGVEAEKRWTALAEPLTLACNEITGRKERDPDTWLTLWKENKKKPKVLFVGE